MCLYPVHITARPKVGAPHSAVVPCGKCLDCLRQKSFEWAFRILDECSVHSENAFITLTYSNDFLPSDKSVSRREVQLFIKRLRKYLQPLKIRFFACGEYGKRFGRPHYHLIIFGWYPNDVVFLKRDGATDLFRSKLIEKCWSKGFSSVGKVTFESAIYCAKYMNKFQFDKIKRDTRLPAPVRPPFVQMSNRPGIGFDCVYRADLVTDRIYRNGKSTKIPRYYLKVMERDGIYLDDFKQMRIRNGEHIASVTDLDEKRKRLKSKYFSLTV